MQHVTFEITDTSQLASSLDHHLGTLPSRNKELLFQIYTHSTQEDTLLEIASIIKKYHENAQILGCSTNGEIIDGKLVEQTTVISITSFFSSKANTYLIDLADTDEIAIGEEFGEHVMQNYPHAKGIILLATAISLDCNDFMNGIQNKTGDIPIFGGGAGDYFAKEKTLVFNNAQMTTKGAAMAVLSGEDLEIIVHSLQGWIPFGQKMEITKAADNIIYEIDHKPAKQLYQHYIGKIEDEIFTDILSFPLMIERGNTSFARAPVYSETEDSLAFLADVEQGDSVRFGYGDINVILDEVNQSVEKLGEFNPDGIYLFSCSCRRIFLGDDVSSELTPFESIAPSVGFFTFGEYSNLSNETNVLNTAYVVAAIKENLPNREHKAEMAPKAIKSTHGSKSMARLMHFISQVTNELEEANARLKDIAKLDGLTGIMNRGAFEEHFELEIKRCKQQDHDMAVIMMDIDHFKSVNDNFGHPIGDNLLKKIAQIINHLICSNDTFARYGGEEFVLLLPNTSLSEALIVAEKLRDAIEVKSGDRFNPHVPSVTSSFGVSTIKDNDFCEKLVIKKADEALYSAKHAGRNRVEWR